MTAEQWISLCVMLAVVTALISGRARADVIALTGAAVLLATGTVRPIEAQAAFASPAIIALASLFVIAYAMELSGLLGLMIRKAAEACDRLGAVGLWLVIVLAGIASAFLNNTPIVVLSAPVVRDVALAQGLSPKRFLIPLSYATILGGSCTLIGTSTNLLVNDMARTGGQSTFGLFEATPVALVIAAVGGLYLFFAAPLLLRGPPPAGPQPQPGLADEPAGDDPTVFPTDRKLAPYPAALSLLVFAGVIAFAATGAAPIAAAAFAGAVLLVVARAIKAEEAYRGLRPEILLLIAGMVVVGTSLEVTGLASTATRQMVQITDPLGPWLTLAVIYGATLLITEVLSNAAVAVLMTPVAIAVAESLGVSARPFLVAVMMAASAAFATPFGYQTNVLVYNFGGYGYLDFVRIGLPLNLITWVVGALTIPLFFPFG